MNRDTKLILLLAGLIVLGTWVQRQIPLPIDSNAPLETVVVSGLPTSQASQPLAASLKQPTQINLPYAKPLTYKTYTLQPVAKYRIQARVLSKHDYWYDPNQALSPTDLALGWNVMADPKVYQKVHISQGGRWYNWNVNTMFLPREQFAHNSANNHIITANPTIHKHLERIQKDQLVDLQGYLVNVTKDDGQFQWLTSTTRQDEGDGACEIFYVERIAWLREPAK